MTFQNKGVGEMPSARLDSRRNSVQNGVVESFPALTGTIFVNVFDFCNPFPTRLVGHPRELTKQNKMRQIEACRG